MLKTQGKKVNNNLFKPIESLHLRRFFLRHTLLLFKATIKIYAYEKKSVTNVTQEHIRDISRQFYWWKMIN